MFCPSCGAETAEGLSYCKRCGARIGASKDEARPKVAGLVWAVSAAIVTITLAGFLMVFGFLVEFGANASGVMMVLLSLMLLVVLAVDYLLARQLSRLVGFHLHGRGDGGARHEQLRPAAQTPAQLEAPRASAYDVTEQTTRTLGELEQPTQTLGRTEQSTRSLDPTPGQREPR